METEKLELSHGCRFELTRYESMEPDVYLEYVENSSDHWHSDRTTSLKLTEEDARKIIAFLTAAYAPNLGATMKTLHEAAAALVDALDGAFISNWQSTAAWQNHLDELRSIIDAERAAAAMATEGKS